MSTPSIGSRPLNTYFAAGSSSASSSQPKYVYNENTIYSKADSQLESDDAFGQRWCRVDHNCEEKWKSRVAELKKDVSDLRQAYQRWQDREPPKLVIQKDWSKGRKFDHDESIIRRIMSPEQIKQRDEEAQKAEFEKALRNHEQEGINIRNKIEETQNAIGKAEKCLGYERRSLLRKRDREVDVRKGLIEFAHENEQLDRLLARIRKGYDERIAEVDEKYDPIGDTLQKELTSAKNSLDAWKKKKTPTNQWELQSFKSEGRNLAESIEGLERSIETNNYWKAKHKSDIETEWTKERQEIKNTWFLEKSECNNFESYWKEREKAKAANHTPRRMAGASLFPLAAIHPALNDDSWIVQHFVNKGKEEEVETTRLHVTPGPDVHPNFDEMENNSVWNDYYNPVDPSQYSTTPEDEEAFYKQFYKDHPRSSVQQVESDATTSIDPEEAGPSTRSYVRASFPIAAMHIISPARVLEPQELSREGELPLEEETVLSFDELRARAHELSQQPELTPEEEREIETALEDFEKYLEGDANEAAELIERSEELDMALSRVERWQTFADAAEKVAQSIQKFAAWNASDQQLNRPGEITNDAFRILADRLNLMPRKLSHFSSHTQRSIEEQIRIIFQQPKETIALLREAGDAFEKAVRSTKEKLNACRKDWESLQGPKEKLQALSKIMAAYEEEERKKYQKTSDVLKVFDAVLDVVGIVGTVVAPPVGVALSAAAATGRSMTGMGKMGNDSSWSRFNEWSERQHQELKRGSDDIENAYQTLQNWNQRLLERRESHGTYLLTHSENFLPAQLIHNLKCKIDDLKEEMFELESRQRTLLAQNASHASAIHLLDPRINEKAPVPSKKHKRSLYPLGIAPGIANDFLESQFERKQYRDHRGRVNKAAAESASRQSAVAMNNTEHAQNDDRLETARDTLAAYMQKLESELERKDLPPHLLPGGEKMRPEERLESIEAFMQKLLEEIAEQPDTEEGRAERSKLSYLYLSQELLLGNCLRGIDLESMQNRDITPQVLLRAFTSSLDRLNESANKHKGAVLSLPSKEAVDHEIRLRKAYLDAQKAYDDLLGSDLPSKKSYDEKAALLAKYDAGVIGDDRKEMYEEKTIEWWLGFKDDKNRQDLYHFAKCYREVEELKKTLAAEGKVREEELSALKIPVDNALNVYLPIQKQHDESRLGAEAAEINYFSEEEFLRMLLAKQQEFSLSDQVILTEKLLEDLEGLCKDRDPKDIENLKKSVSMLKTHALNLKFAALEQKVAGAKPGERYSLFINGIKDIDTNLRDFDSLIQTLKDDIKTFKELHPNTTPESAEGGELYAKERELSLLQEKRESAQKQRERNILSAQYMRLADELAIVGGDSLDPGISGSYRQTSEHMREFEQREIWHVTERLTSQLLSLVYLYGRTNGTGAETLRDFAPTLENAQAFAQMMASMRTLGEWVMQISKMQQEQGLHLNSNRSWFQTLSEMPWYQLAGGPITAVLGVLQSGIVLAEQYGLIESSKEPTLQEILFEMRNSLISYFGEKFAEIEALLVQQSESLARIESNTNELLRGQEELLQHAEKSDHQDFKIATEKKISKVRDRCNELMRDESPKDFFKYISQQLEESRSRSDINGATLEERIAIRSPEKRPALYSGALASCINNEEKPERLLPRRSLLLDLCLAEELKKADEKWKLSAPECKECWAEEYTKLKGVLAQHLLITRPLFEKALPTLKSAQKKLSSLRTLLEKVREASDARGVKTTQALVEQGKKAAININLRYAEDFFNRRFEIYRNEVGVTALAKDPRMLFLNTVVGGGIYVSFAAITAIATPLVAVASMPLITMASSSLLRLDKLELEMLQDDHAINKLASETLLNYRNLNHYLSKQVDLFKQYAAFMKGENSLFNEYCSGTAYELIPGFDAKTDVWAGQRQPITLAFPKSALDLANNESMVRELHEKVNLRGHQFLRGYTLMTLPSGELCIALLFRSKDDKARLRDLCRIPLVRLDSLCTAAFGRDVTTVYEKKELLALYAMYCGATKSGLPGKGSIKIDPTTVRSPDQMLCAPVDHPHRGYFNELASLPGFYAHGTFENEGQAAQPVAFWVEELPDADEYLKPFNLGSHDNIRVRERFAGYEKAAGRTIMFSKLQKKFHLGVFKNALFATLRDPKEGAIEKWCEPSPKPQEEFLAFYEGQPPSRVSLRLEEVLSEFNPEPREEATV